jgi:hypothetical protein
MLLLVPPATTVDSASKIVAVVVGALIGVVTGAGLTLLLVSVGTAEKKERPRRIMIIFGELLAIPAFWFGGPWLAGRLLVNTRLEDSLAYYALALAIAFALIIWLPLYKMVLRAAILMEKA